MEVSHDPNPLTIFWSEENAGCIAEVPDLPGCSACGATEVTVTEEARRAIAAWIEAAHMAGRETPSVSSPSTFATLSYAGESVDDDADRTH
jgi:predicted RNase H-like HicB family nuclease